MRKVAILATLGPVLALAACAENTGWNPNYSAVGSGTGYGKYSREREAALHGNAPIPRTVPVQLPAEAPTPADIAPQAAPATTTAAATGAAGRRPAEVPANAPVATTGPYPGSTPVLVRYAYQEQHDPGKTVYRRTGGSVLDAGRTCSTYATSDVAQRAFIAAGGPILDPRGMDPDGDGFVCGWDPRPLRNNSSGL